MFTYLDINTRKYTIYINIFIYISLTFSLAARVPQRFVVIFEVEGAAAMVVALSGSRCYGWLLIRPDLLLSHLHSFLHNRFLSLTLPSFLRCRISSFVGFWGLSYASLFLCFRIGGMFLDVSVSAADDCKKFLVVIF
jgi:hypothetical protein